MILENYKMMFWLDWVVEAVDLRCVPVMEFEICSIVDSLD